jgi:hypothetical protein
MMLSRVVHRQDRVVDETDQKIVELYVRTGGCRSATSPVTRDSRRHRCRDEWPSLRPMESIRGYTAIVDDGATGELDAFTEVRLTGVDRHPPDRGDRPAGT